MKDFWNRFAGIYDFVIKKDDEAYHQMYDLIRPCIKEKLVLELAAGTGIIARSVASVSKSYVATDFSPEMIALTKKTSYTNQLDFSVQDMFHLTYGSHSFEMIIISNALHIILEPERVLTEVKRILTDDGIFIAPTFTHANIGIMANLKVNIMRLCGFPLCNAWSPDDYQSFLEQNEFYVRKV